MADHYQRYPSAERDSRTAVPGYVPSDVHLVAKHHAWSAGDMWGTSNFLQNDALPLRSGSYGLDDRSGASNLSTPGLGGLPVRASVGGYTPLEDPALLRRDVAFSNKPGIAEIERSDHSIKSKGLPADESSILYVDGLPADCTRREVAHLFRPFIGFKEIKVVHKEPRRTGDKAHALCFVEFTDAKCALTALEALQGYKFDDKKPNSPVLRIQFAKFPFRPSSIQDDRRH